MSPEQLIGAWRLERFVITFGRGSELLPFGEDPAGLVVYAAGGWMSAQLGSSDRPPLLPEGEQALERAGRADDHAKAGAFDGYVAYAGRWRLEGEEVVHAVELALVPDLVGQTLRRRARLEGDLLRLSYTRRTSRGQERLHILDWSRA